MISKQISKTVPIEIQFKFQLYMTTVPTILFSYGNSPYVAHSRVDRMRETDENTQSPLKLFAPK